MVPRNNTTRRRQTVRKAKEAVDTLIKVDPAALADLSEDERQKLGELLAKVKK